METNVKKEAINEILKEMKKDFTKSSEREIPIRGKNLFEFTRNAICQWNSLKKRERAIKDAIKKTKKEELNKKIPRWVIELPLYRISDQCKNQILELIEIDLQNQFLSKNCEFNT
jgi:hypothetical protein